MIFTSKHINHSGPITVSGKSGFFAQGEVAQKKLYAVEHVPLWPGEPGLILPLLPLAHAAVGILLSLPILAHSGTVRVGHHRTAGAPKTPHRTAVWAALRYSFRSAAGHELLTCWNVCGFESISENQNLPQSDMYSYQGDCSDEKH